MLVLEINKLIDKYSALIIHIWSNVTSASAGRPPLALIVNSSSPKTKLKTFFVSYTIQSKSLWNTVHLVYSVLKKNNKEKSHKRNRPFQICTNHYLFSAKRVGINPGSQFLLIILHRRERRANAICRPPDKQLHTDLTSQPDNWKSLEK